MSSHFDPRWWFGPFSVPATPSHQASGGATTPRTALIPSTVEFPDVFTLPPVEHIGGAPLEGLLEASPSAVRRLSFDSLPQGGLRATKAVKKRGAVGNAACSPGRSLELAFSRTSRAAASSGVVSMDVILGEEGLGIVTVPSTPPAGYIFPFAPSFSALAILRESPILRSAEAALACISTYATCVEYKSPALYCVSLFCSPLAKTSPEELRYGRIAQAWHPLILATEDAPSVVEYCTSVSCIPYLSAASVEELRWACRDHPPPFPALVVAAHLHPAAFTSLTPEDVQEALCALSQASLCLPMTIRRRSRGEEQPPPWATFFSSTWHPELRGLSTALLFKCFVAASALRLDKKRMIPLLEEAAQRGANWDSAALTAAFGDAALPTSLHAIAAKMYRLCLDPFFSLLRSRSVNYHFVHGHSPHDTDCFDDNHSMDPLKWFSCCHFGEVMRGLGTFGAPPLPSSLLVSELQRRQLEEECVNPWGPLTYLEFSLGSRIRELDAIFAPKPACATTFQKLSDALCRCYGNCTLPPPPSSRAFPLWDAVKAWGNLTWKRLRRLPALHLLMVELEVQECVGALCLALAGATPPSPPSPLVDGSPAASIQSPLHVFPPLTPSPSTLDPPPPLDAASPNPTLSASLLGCLGSFGKILGWDTCRAPSGGGGPIGVLPQVLALPTPAAVSDSTSSSSSSSAEEERDRNFSRTWSLVVGARGLDVPEAPLLSVPWWAAFGHFEKAEAGLKGYARRKVEDKKGVESELDDGEDLFLATLEAAALTGSCERVGHFLSFISGSASGISSPAAIASEEEKRARSLFSVAGRAGRLLLFEYLIERGALERLGIREYESATKWAIPEALLGGHLPILRVWWEQEQSRWSNPQRDFAKTFGLSLEFESDEEIYFNGDCYLAPGVLEWGVSVGLGHYLEQQKEVLVGAVLAKNGPGLRAILHRDGRFHHECAALLDVCVVAAQEDLPTLRWLRERGAVWEGAKERIITAAMRNRDCAVEACTYVLSHDPPVLSSLQQEEALCAALTGWREYLRPSFFRLLRSSAFEWGPTLLTALASHGGQDRSPLIFVLKERSPPFPHGTLADQDAGVAAWLSAGSTREKDVVEVLELFHGSNFRFGSGTFASATRLGASSCTALAMLQRWGCVRDAEEATLAAVTRTPVSRWSPARPQKECLEVLTWLNMHDCLRLNPRAMTAALSPPSLELIPWLLAHNCPVTTAVLASACSIDPEAHAQRTGLSKAAARKGDVEKQLSLLLPHAPLDASVAAAAARCSDSEHAISLLQVLAAEKCPLDASVVFSPSLSPSSPSPSLVKAEVWRWLVESGGCPFTEGACAAFEAKAQKWRRKAAECSGEHTHPDGNMCECQRDALRKAKATSTLLKAHRKWLLALPCPCNGRLHKAPAPTAEQECLICYESLLAPPGGEDDEDIPSLYLAAFTIGGASPTTSSISTTASTATVSATATATAGERAAAAEDEDGDVATSAEGATIGGGAVLAEVPFSTCAACEVFLHTACLQMWSAKSVEEGKEVKCPHCRGKWHDAPPF